MEAPTKDPSSMKNTQEDEETTNLVKDIFRPGQTPGQSVAAYDEWSKNYEESLSQGVYNAPYIAVQEVERLVAKEQRERFRVLDVAAGTGWVGRELSKIGFKDMDALEPSEGMMNLLKKTNVYTLTFQEFLGVGQTSVPKGVYDVVVLAGGMGDGHIPVSGVDELIHFAKPGGLVIIVMRLEFLETAKEYKGKLEPHMDRLEKDGRWCKIARKLVPNYYLDKEGVVFTYRVL
ncbi:methyltransferase-like protein 27 [Panulirus ornatus]|uniref:methyltransferase-like protein 27 n=1 Tax=Panulirus ornatus TaxID=150431 RepID=UPI003A83C9E7